jgi:hypothetical protein
MGRTQGVNDNSAPEIKKLKTTRRKLSLSSLFLIKEVSEIPSSFKFILNLIARGIMVGG